MSAFVPRRRRQRIAAASLLLSSYLHPAAIAFTTPPCSPRCLLRRPVAASTQFKNIQKLHFSPQNDNNNNSPLEDEPWQADESYWDRLQEASKDPEAFEKFIEESVARKKLAAGGGERGASSSETLAKNGVPIENGTESPPTKKKKGKYVPIEEWDAARQNDDSMQREERLQWESQRGGDRFRQNEILRHNLKSF